MLDSDKEEDDSGILGIFGLNRDEFTGFIVVVAAILLALLYFRGCSSIPDPKQTILPQSADGLAEADREGKTAVTDLRIGYRPDYVHFDGTGEKSQPVELFINGASVGETATTFR
ncbi:MAG: hypothetical protein AB8G95_26145, partial [Anaerolineae bacterium]